MLEWETGINMNIPIDLMCGNENNGDEGFYYIHANV